MNKLVVSAVFAAISLPISSPLLAAPQSVTLSIPGMNCPACPITIKKALTKVAGVNKVEVNLEKRVALVTFDDAKAKPDALTRATKDAGYPSTVLGAPQ